MGNVGKHLAIDLRGAKRWQCRLPALDVDEISASVRTAWSTVYRLLSKRQVRTAAELQIDLLFQLRVLAGRDITNRMAALISQLVRAVRALDPSVESTIAKLVGLGHGLTPSADDFLVGYLAGLQCTAMSSSDRLLYLKKFRKIVVRLSTQTNDISRTHLWYAAHGQVSSHLCALAQIIARGENSDRLMQAAEQSLNMGHSSGMDAVSGLLLGLATWGNGFRPYWPAMPSMPLAGPQFCVEPVELAPPGSPLLGN